jgi:hypothetical protein
MAKRFVPVLISLIGIFWRTRVRRGAGCPDTRRWSGNRLISTATPAIAPIHRNARTKGARRKGGSCEMMMRSSGSIHKPSTGRKENTPPRTRSVDTRMRALRRVPPAAEPYLASVQSSQPPISFDPAYKCLRLRRIALAPADCARRIDTIFRRWPLGHHEH